MSDSSFDADAILQAGSIAGRSPNSEVDPKVEALVVTGGGRSRQPGTWPLARIRAAAIPRATRFSAVRAAQRNPAIRAKAMIRGPGPGVGQGV